MILYRKYFLDNIKYCPEAKFLTKSITKLAPQMNFDFDAEVMDPNDHAAILFTSGGTGKPKGVVYTHEIFINQTKMLQNEFGLESEDVDIPGFPLFALFRSCYRA